MRRLRLPIPISIVLFLALTLAGTYYVRKGLLEQAMSSVPGATPTIDATTAYGHVYAHA